MAIKIVEHSLKGAAAEIEGARESLLAASISHPNVVRTHTPHLRQVTAGCLAAPRIQMWCRLTNSRGLFLPVGRLAGRLSMLSTGWYLSMSCTEPATRHSQVLKLQRHWQVACYKICTVRLNLPQGASSDADSDQTDANVSLPPSQRASAKVKCSLVFRLLCACPQA